ncbi:MAG TPA: EamA family transporter [Thermoanaerobaculia bacterium]|nr:EamA family transporter [Thermoanaerobaculia bacterium]
MTHGRFYLIGFGALVLCDTWTQVAFKLASHQTGEFIASTHWLQAAAVSPWILGAIAGYLGSFITWMTLLKYAPVGPAFAASHMDVVSVLIVSVLLFGEHMTLGQIAGAACIIGGIILLSLSESKHGDAT